MSRRLDIVRRLTCIAVMLTASACADDHALTAPDTRDEVDEPPSSPQSTVGHGIFDERAHALSAADFTLLSSPEELTSGHYRFRALTDEVPVLERDDFIVLDDADGTKQVRRVLGATTQGDELVLETGHAYLHEIIREGSYTLTVPLGGPGAARFSSPEAATISVGPTRVDLPPLEGSFDDYDVCAVLHDVLALIPGPREIEVCGKYVEMEVAYGVSVGIAGRLDSLRILDGNVRLTGDADIGLTMDAGGISGGRPPVFYPCNRGAYPGCLKTPTGANLIDFLRQYAPAIPEASLAPVRVCVPGTPVRTRAGYWSGLRWTPPVFVRCRIEDIGQLPTVILPSLAAAFTEVRPRLQGEMTVRAVGDGKFTLEVPIPSLAYKAGYQVTNDFKAMAAIGVFIKLQATLNNGGATVKLMFDDTGRLTQTWSGQAGWEQDFELVDRNNHAQLLDLTNPDSTVIRVSTPVKVKAEACVAIWSCGEPDEPGKPDLEAQMTVLGRELFKGFNLGVEAGVGVSMLEDLIYTRDQVHPDDPDVDNWHMSLEGAYDLFAKAGVHIPLTGWILPQVPREVGDEWECCRVSTSDIWGQGLLEVSTSTTGADPDPDGYRVIVERADTLPPVMDAGVRRVGDGWPAQPFEQYVDTNGTASFGSVAPCLAVYSDAFITASPVWGTAVAGARALGLDIPTWGITSPCRWLIARYRVTLADVAANCAVVGGAARDSVWLQQQRISFPAPRDNVRRLHFDVECSPADALGSLAVVLDRPYHAVDVQPSLVVDGEIAAVFESDTVRLNGLAPGVYQLELRSLRTFCHSDAFTGTVVAGDTTVVTPFVVCALPNPAAGTVTFRTTTSGDGNDVNGYGVARDGVPAVQLPSDGTAEVTNLPAAQPTVLHVTDIAGNCQAQGPNPRLITLDAARTPVSLPFDVVCSAARADTLTGVINATAWPASAATLRTANGTTLSVNGPKTAELARLTGIPVRVWGRASATGINVHGYDLPSQVGADRRLGIVLQRADGLWLLGAEAIRLVNPPPGLAAESGKLIWVLAQEVAGGMQVSVYGVIREG